MAFDWTTLGTLVGVGATAAVTYTRAAVRAGRLADAVAENTAKVEEVRRHMEGLMSAEWWTAMRVATMEDHLARTDDYHPPVLVPNPGTGPG